MFLFSRVLTAAELVSFPGNGYLLAGFLHRPEGDGPFPVVVFNHGSEQLPGDKAGQAAFFLPRGYVVFVPHRRGHGRSGGTYAVASIEREPEVRRDSLRVAELLNQVDDVEAAVAFVRTLPYVDPRRVFMSGCSFGGIETVLASERDLGVRAGVDFAGASITWRSSPQLQARMQQAAREAKFPIFFVQAENDYDTTPSKILAKTARQHVLKIFPPHGTTPEDGHAFCGGGRAPAWGDDVLRFFESAK